MDCSLWGLINGSHVYKSAYDSHKRKPKVHKLKEIADRFSSIMIAIVYISGLSESGNIIGLLILHSLKKQLCFFLTRTANYSIIIRKVPVVHGKTRYTKCRHHMHDTNRLKFHWMCKEPIQQMPKKGGKKKCVSIT